MKIQRIGFYEELEQVFDHFPTYYIQILLGCCKAKFWREATFKPSPGKYHIVCIHQTLDANHLFIDYKKTYDLFRRKVLNNILIEFGISI